MIEFLIVLILAIVIAVVLFSILKKVVKLALFLSLVLVVFLVIGSIIYPESNLIQNGKNYILEKSKSTLEKGADKVTSYVIIEANETLNKAKATVLAGFED